jgi:hypothetical protein
MKSDIIIQLHKNFEDYAQQIDGEEFWLARDLQGLLGYSKWENFAKVIDKAKIACQTAGHNVSDHFPDVRKMIPMPEEYVLLVKNGNSSHAKARWREEMKKSDKHVGDKIDGLFFFANFAASREQMFLRIY